MSQLTHLDSQGHAQMVDVGDKAETQREASAEAYVNMTPDTLALIESGGHKKGDVLAVARIAAIQAAKQTQHLIPLCHQLPLSFAGVEFELTENAVTVTCTVRTTAQTGVEMEALTGASVAALTIYDMCKAVDKKMVITEVMLQSKTKNSQS